MDSLIQKFNTIKSNLSNQPNFFFDDIARLFPDMKDSSLYWLVSKLVSGGYLIRQRKGMYSINEWKDKRRVSITGEAKRLYDKLEKNLVLTFLYRGLMFCLHICTIYQSNTL